MYCYLQQIQQYSLQCAKIHQVVDLNTSESKVLIDLYKQVISNCKFHQDYVGVHTSKYTHAVQYYEYIETTQGL